MIADTITLNMNNESTGIAISYGRISAQVISGIGFLGAGTIFISQKKIAGLTTAASLWNVACLGLAVGMGYYIISLAGCAIVIITLALLQRLVVQQRQQGLAVHGIDALFGVGLSRPLNKTFIELTDAIERARISGAKVLAVDIPSGIHADTGAVMGTALKADVTVTFGWEKMGTALYPGRGYGGKVLVEDIGFPEMALEGEEEESGRPERAFAYEKEDLCHIPGRKADSNKGTFGKVLIAAGSAGMCGAAYLSALTAYKAGAGLVKVLTVEENRPILQGLLPEAIMVTYTPDQLIQGREEFKEMIEEQMKWASVVVLGPGLGSEPYVEYLVEDILTSAYVPVILDADGLNTVASHPYLTSYYTENIIITPHLGEMARLTGQTISQLKEDLVGAASAYASRYGVTCVLKDAATVVAGQEGGLYINTSGCSAMAKAGSGDVLTGTIAGLLAIGMEEEEAARMGVYVHGLAGEKAAAAGSHSLLATELSRAVGDVMDEAVRCNE